MAAEVSRCAVLMSSEAAQAALAARPGAAWFLAPEELQWLQRRLACAVLMSSEAAQAALAARPGTGLVPGGRGAGVAAGAAGPRAGGAGRPSSPRAGGHGVRCLPSPP